MSCGGKDIPWDEINTPQQKALRNSVFPGVVGGLQEGPQTPPFPINAPWDKNFAAGANMYRKMGGMSPDYQPQQMPVMFNPDWQPKWPEFPDYKVGLSQEEKDKLKNDAIPDWWKKWWEENKHRFGK